MEKPANKRMFIHVDLIPMLYYPIFRYNSKY